MTNAYCDLAAFKSAGSLNIAGSSYDQRLLALLEGAARRIDGYCNRYFYVTQAIRRFAGDGGQQLLVPDLIAVEKLSTQVHPQGPAVVWPAGDYRLYPLDAAPEKPWGRPHTRLSSTLAGVKGRCFPPGPATVAISGRWGFRQVTEAGGALAEDAALTAAADAFTLAEEGQLSPGQTLAIGAEQLYVTAVDGTAVTVQRGVNGSRPAAHRAGSAVAVYRYPAPIVEACRQIAAQAWRSRDGAAASAGGQRPEPGRDGLPAEVIGLLTPFRKLPV